MASLALSSLLAFSDLVALDQRQKSADIFDQAQLIDVFAHQKNIIAYIKANSNNFLILHEECII
jgi:hypothetical protein